MPPAPVRRHSGTMSTTDDERALALRFGTGEADAVREVYRRYTGRLHTLCRSMLGDPALERPGLPADDLETSGATRGPGLLAAAARQDPARTVRAIAAPVRVELDPTPSVPGAADGACKGCGRLAPFITPD